MYYYYGGSSVDTGREKSIYELEHESDKTDFVRFLNVHATRDEANDSKLMCQFCQNPVQAPWFRRSISKKGCTARHICPTVVMTSKICCCLGKASPGQFCSVHCRDEAHKMRFSARRPMVLQYDSNSATAASAGTLGNRAAAIAEETAAAAPKRSKSWSKKPAPSRRRASQLGNNIQKSVEGLYAPPPAPSSGGVAVAADRRHSLAIVSEDDAAALKNPDTAAALWIRMSAGAPVHVVFRRTVYRRCFNVFRASIRFSFLVFFFELLSLVLTYATCVTLWWLLVSGFNSIYKTSWSPHTAVFCNDAPLLTHRMLPGFGFKFRTHPSVSDVHNHVCNLHFLQDQVAVVDTRNVYV